LDDPNDSQDDGKYPQDGGIHEFLLLGSAVRSSVYPATPTAKPLGWFVPVCRLFPPGTADTCVVSSGRLCFTLTEGTRVTDRYRFTESSEAAVHVDEALFRRLRVYNVVMGSVHAASAAAMIALSNGFSVGLGAFSIGGPPGTPVRDGAVLSVVDYPLAWGTALFLGLSAVFHFLVATVAAGLYRRELERGRNRFRWIEYSLSATLMIVLIANLTGVLDVAALIGISVANISMILFGWIMEMTNRPGEQVWWTPFWFGCVAGAGPWIAIGWSLIYGANHGSKPPGFVYAIIASLFVLFNAFAVNQWLQYRRLGPWRNYLFGERGYIALSLIAKSVLAWQVFANVLID
jgi:hypothetical protein